MSERSDSFTAIRSTYRLQFHREFTFRDAIALVPYLASLGVSHIYASPIMEARPGSTHGYDIINHNRLNPEIGTETDFRALVDALHAHSMGLILFGLVYGYLALAHEELLFDSPCLLLVGLAMVCGFVILAKLFWFSLPFWSLCVALACSVASIAVSRG